MAEGSHSYPSGCPLLIVRSRSLDALGRRGGGCGEGGHARRAWPVFIWYVGRLIRNPN